MSKIFRDLEISVISDDSLVVDYKRLSKKQQKKLYSLSVLALATMNLDELIKCKVAPNFNVFSPMLGFAVPTWIWLVFIGSIIALLLIGAVQRVEWRKDNILENLFYFLIALAPGIYVVLVALGIC